MTDPIEIMKQLYASNYRGPIGPRLQEVALAEQQGMDVASTPQEKIDGLNVGPPRNLKIPGAESIIGANAGPIDIATVDQESGLVRSEIPDVQPGELVETGPGVDVLEFPKFKNGGSVHDRVKAYMDKRRRG